MSAPAAGDYRTRVPAKPNHEVALKAVNIEARYGRITVTRSASIEVAPGQVLALLGPNGAGKTSLVSSIAGLVRSSGEVLLANERIDHLSAPKRARRGLAFVPEGRALFSTMTVYENLQQGMRLAPRGGGSLDRVYEMFPRLEERSNQIAGMLSGGEQQMLAIARAIVGDPKVLVLDEPTQGLAPHVHGTLVDRILRLRDMGMALVVVEQNQAFASRIADVFTVMRSGRVVGGGGKEMLSDREGMKNLYLGVNE